MQGLQNKEPALDAVPESEGLMQLRKCYCSRAIPMMTDKMATEKWRLLPSLPNHECQDSGCGQLLWLYRRTAASLYTLWSIQPTIFDDLNDRTCKRYLGGPSSGDRFQYILRPRKWTLPEGPQVLSLLMCLLRLGPLRCHVWITGNGIGRAETKIWDQLRSRKETLLTISEHKLSAQEV